MPPFPNCIVVGVDAASAVVENDGGEYDDASKLLKYDG
jgi:hypothetical protein